MKSGIQGPNEQYINVNNLFILLFLDLIYLFAR